jgi:2-dehydro-3-deoxyphosphogluconate aldolase / (4S)-4-hydroxy-2-oxoglutarate aldolase
MVTGEHVVNLAGALHANRLVAIVRGSDPGAALQTVLALFDEGVQMVEVSLTTTGSLAGLRQRAHLFLTAVSDQEPEAT